MIMLPLLLHGHRRNSILLLLLRNTTIGSSRGDIIEKQGSSTSNFNYMQFSPLKAHASLLYPYVCPCHCYVVVAYICRGCGDE